MGRAAQHGVRDGCGQALEAVARGGFDLGIRIVGQREEHGGEFDCGQGQGASRRHQARISRSILAGVALGLGGQGQADFCRLSLH